MINVEILNSRQVSADEMVTLWLDNKMHRSNSQHTRRAYSDNMQRFRTHLQSRNLDIDSGTIFVIAQEAQLWATRDDPAPSTYNNRLGTIESFYTYARKVQLLACENPMDFLDRAQVQPYTSVKALDFALVREKLDAIDRTTLKGKRDYTFIVVALHTGRRRSELISLRMGDLEINGAHITLIFRRCKGGKVMHDTLTVAVSQILRDYLTAVYGEAFDQQLPTAAVWVSCDPSHKGEAVRSTAAYRIVYQHLEITSVHRLRHTFARGMEEVGAKVSDIQERLGHSNLSTTSIYLGALRRDENPCGAQLDSLFGIEAQTSAVATSDGEGRNTDEIVSQPSNQPQTDQSSDDNRVRPRFGEPDEQNNQGTRHGLPDSPAGCQMSLWEGAVPED
jgi:site-specific recombinase XerD